MSRPRIFSSKVFGLDFGLKNVIPDGHGIIAMRNDRVFHSIKKGTVI
jgi:hypothetical protein